MQAPFDIPADLDTPLSAYLKLAPLGARFLFENAAGPGRTARYSLLGFGPASELVLDGRGLRRDGIPLPAPRTRVELLATLRAALAEAPALAAPGQALPFRGGLVGVLGFDLVRRLERLPAPRPCDQPELHLLAPSALLCFDHARRSAALLLAGHEPGSPGHRALQAEVRRCLSGPLPSRPGGGRCSAPRPDLGRAEFLARVRRAEESIRAGEVYQLVLSNAARGETDLPALEIYRALRLTNPSPYMALLELDGLSVVAASPESLVRLENGRASLQPIAGTRPRGRDALEDQALEQELLDDPKEAAEHVMLVDLARNDLGRVARPGTITVAPFRSVERYSHVMHLVSGVSGAVAPGVDALELFAACFPAGTVVGAPKLRAIELLDELEPASRGLYGGTLGYFGQGGTMDQALAIRTLFLQDGRYRYQAGAGIVADSRPEREFDEITAKGAVMLRALELAAEGLS